MSFFPSLTAYTQITTAGCFLPSSPQAPLQGNVTLRLLRCSSPTSLSASVTEILLSRTSFLHPTHQRNTIVPDCFRSPPSWRGYPALDPMYNMSVFRVHGITVVLGFGKGVLKCVKTTFLLQFVFRLFQEFGSVPGT